MPQVLIVECNRMLSWASWLFMTGRKRRKTGTKEVGDDDTWRRVECQRSVKILSLGV
ncbi:hypothetical protein ANAPC5_01364 [Anaplasma phagocytophilum]|nr:hypothetical protein ANAPC5_01364 [Anaplasma phagocytophilum]